MSYILNPFRYVVAGEEGGGDYVTISTSATVNVDSGDGDYKYIEFDSTTSSAFEVTDAGGSGSNTIEVYCIGGGGGGGVSSTGGGGGGGAGGYVRETSFNNGSTGLAQTYDVTIGGGGAATASGSDTILNDTVSRSTDFDGSTDYLSTPTSADWTIGSGDYTVEMWIKTTSTQGELISAFNSDSPYEGWLFGVGSFVNTGKLEVWFADDMDNEYYISNTAVNDGEWHHVAFTKDSTTLRFFLDGEADGEEELMVDSTSSGQAILIGAANNSTPNRFFDGLMSNIRVVKGTALYTAAFTPPFSNLTAVTNTKLLIQPNTDQSAWTDESTSSHTLTATGLSWPTDLSTDLSTVRSFGGGRGSRYAATLAEDGGSGGGGSGGWAYGANGFRGQGNDGGDATGFVGAGGGGASAVGADSPSALDGGDGGAGQDYAWMSSNSLGADGAGYYAGGGGGGSSGAGGGGSSGTGGDGGGGDGDYYSGTTNSGGGGGGGNLNAGAGGSGKILIRWKFQN